MTQASIRQICLSLQRLAQIVLEVLVATRPELHTCICGAIVFTCGIQMDCTKVRGADGSNLDLLRVIGESYKANRAAFDSGMCRFRYSILYADSEEDAIQGHWNDRHESVYTESTLYVDGEMFTIKSEINNDELVSKLEADAPLLPPVNIAKSGPFAIDHDGLINTAIVHSPNNYNLTIPFHPFNLALDADGLDPASIIDDAVARNFEGISLTVEETSKDGRSYLLLKQSSDENSSDWHYYIDPERGYLPIMMEVLKKEDHVLRGRMLVLNLEEDNGVFFPTHSMFILPRTPPDAPPYVQVREMKVLELDLDYMPTEEDLTIYLPKHTQYSDGMNPNTAKTLYREQDDDMVGVSANQIESIYNQLQGLAVEREADQAALVERRDIVPGRSKSRFYILAAVNGVAFLTLVAIYAFRRRSAASRLR